MGFLWRPRALAGYNRSPLREGEIRGKVRSMEHERPPAGLRRVDRPEENLPVPEGWVGRPARLVFVSGSSTEYADGVLEEVNDRGIVLSFEAHVGQPARPVFYPWGAVIQLSEAQNG